MIIPVQKIRNLVTAGDYRPVNMLPTSEKILETAVHKQVEKYFTKNKLISRQQSGFRNKHKQQFNYNYQNGKKQ